MKIRLYSENKLSIGENIDLTKEQAHYIANVLRCKPGEELFIFNDASGEFRAIFRDRAGIEITEQTKEPRQETRLSLVFAPVKFGKIDMLAQKATELGVTALQPVQTRFTMVGRINYERLKANAVEAAEQTGRITIPEVNEIEDLDKLLSKWDVMQKIIFCDETLSGKPIAETLASLPKSDFGYAILIGPEGGFSKDEIELLREKPFVIPVTMGRRLLRAETAALAALSVFQSSHLGDWQQ